MIEHLEINNWITKRGTAHLHDFSRNLGAFAKNINIYAEHRAILSKPMLVRQDPGLRL